MSTELVWKPVKDVGLPAPRVTNHNYPNNHYDTTVTTSTVQGTVADDLEAGPQEEMAMFVSLDVLDAASYKVFSKQLQQKRKQQQQQQQQPSSSPQKNGNHVEKDSNKRRRLVPNDKAELVNTTMVPKQKNKKQKKIQTNTKPSFNDTHETLSTSTPDIDSTNNNNNNNKSTISSLDQVSLEWMQGTRGVVLHDVLVSRLVDHGWITPTPIQQATLAASILGHCNIVGAAPTGSGKTLSFLLPIGQWLLEQQQQQHSSNDKSANSHNRTLQALIVTPTRELALQIAKVGIKLLGRTSHNNKPQVELPWGSHPIGCVVGGLAHAKQERILQRSQPPIVVGTPGRLWELVRFNKCFCFVVDCGCMMSEVCAWVLTFVDDDEIYILFNSLRTAL